MSRQLLAGHSAAGALSTGIRLRYSEAGDPAAPPAILLHGYSDAALRAHPATGHAPHWERPAQVAQDLRAPLAGVRP